MGHVSRRSVVIGGISLLCAPSTWASSERIELNWADLIPRGARGTTYESLRSAFGIIQHGQLSTGFFQNRDASVTTEYNGKLVRIPGYMVPLDFAGTGVTDLLLVPYVGACIHVPPPPPNQIVLVKVAAPFEVTGYFEPIYVTGTIQTMAVATELAEIGYTITDARVEPYD
ncbi:MAG: DUF3299 domain-containing protein [Pseudomonadota bacterium]